MKLYRNAVILLAVLALLMGAYFYYDYKTKNAPPKQSETQLGNDIITIFKTDLDNINELVLAGKDATFKLERQNGKWVQSEPKNIVMDDSKINSVAGSFSYISADKIIEENASDLGIYGLKTPTATATVKLKDGTAKVFLVGDKTPSKASVFFKDKDSNTVYTISNYMAENINLNIDELRPKELFTLNPEEVIGFTLTKSGNVSFSATKDDKGWKLTQPVPGAANENNLLPIIDKSAGLGVVKFVEENPVDLEKYGLANPSYTIEMKTADKKDKLLIGRETVKGREAYAKMEKSNNVYVMDLSSADFLDKIGKDVLDSFVYIVNIDKVSRLVMETSGRKTVSDIDTDKSGNKENDKIKVNGKDLNAASEEDMKKFKEYYQAAIGVFVGDIDLSGKPSGQPEVTLTYTLLEEPGTMKVEFISRDKDSYYVMKNGTYAGVYATRQSIENLKKLESTLLDYLGK